MKVLRYIKAQLGRAHTSTTPTIEKNPNRIIVFPRHQSATYMRPYFSPFSSQQYFTIAFADAEYRALTIGGVFQLNITSGDNVAIFQKAFIDDKTQNTSQCCMDLHRVKLRSFVRSFR